jgi:hypothetical protein
MPTHYPSTVSYVDCRFASRPRAFIAAKSPLMYESRDNQGAMAMMLGSSGLKR